jgi:hypothetical protein
MPRWGQARKEVLSCKSLILQRLSEGWSIRALHADLLASGLISVTIKHFDNQIKKQLGYVPGKPLPSAGIPMVVRAIATPTQHSAPRIEPIPTADDATGLLPKDLGVLFGNGGFQHQPRAEQLSLKAPDEPGAEPSPKSKEQKDAG